MRFFYLVKVSKKDESKYKLWIQIGFCVLPVIYLHPESEPVDTAYAES